MKTFLRTSKMAFMIAAFYSSTMFSQNNVVGFSVFDMGFEVSPSGNFIVTSVAGQTAADVVQERNTRIEGGFINSRLFGGTSIAVLVKSDNALAGRSVGVTVRLPPTVQTFAESLFYRKGGERIFTSLALQKSGDSLRATLPADVVTIRGIEYFIRVLSQQGVIRFPPSGVDTIRVRVENVTSALSFGQRVYKMISVPVELNDSTTLGVLSDDYGAYNPSRWRVFRWENETNVEHPNISARFRPGKAFWLITQQGAGFDIDQGKSVPTISPFTMLLDTGWNQIASPFAFPVAWSSIITSGQVSTPYYFDGLSPYQPKIAVLQPWEGYFVENRSGEVVTLSVPSIEAPAALPKANDPFVLKSEHDFVIQLTASAEGTVLKDIYNYLGFIEGAAIGDDSLDLHEPPSIGEYIQIATVDQRMYLSNFKPLQGEGQQWDIELRSTRANARVHIALQQSGVMPDGFNMYLLDKEEYNRIPLNENTFSVQTRAPRAVRSFKMIIGTEAYAQSNNDGIPLVPIAYALDQNYPNPFNPSTTIRYQLNKRSSVALEIYNILGQRMKTLVNNEQVTGSYSVVWNGENESGNIAASGVYIYRLRAGDFVASRKLMLLR